MARRNKDTRLTTQRPREVERLTPASAEDLAQRRQFLVWVTVITIAFVAMIYFLLFR